MNSPQSFNVARVRAACPKLQLFHFDELGSTNDWALENASRLNLDGMTVVLASRQSAGRGRGAHSWQSPNGSLTLSLLFEPDLDQFNRSHTGWSWPVAVSFASALAIRDLIRSFLPTSNVLIKWPNDLLLESRKVSGVLIETAWITVLRNTEEPPGTCAEKSSLHAPAPRKPICVVGVGLNVNLQPQQIASISTSTIPATSLSIHAGHLLDLSDVTIRLVQEFTRQLTRASILSNDTTTGSNNAATFDMLQDYNQSLAWQGKQVRLDLDDTFQEGRLSTVNSAGQLEVEVRGVLVRFDSSAVRTLRLAE